MFFLLSLALAKVNKKKIEQTNEVSAVAFT